MATQLDLSQFGGSGGSTQDTISNPSTQLDLSKFGGSGGTKDNSPDSASKLDLSGFMDSNSTPSDSPAPSAGWNGPLNNPIGRFIGANALADLVSGKVNDFENWSGLNKLNGAYRGISNPNHFDTNITPSDGSYLGNLSNWGQNAIAAVKNLGQSAVEGFNNPDATSQRFNDTLNKNLQNFDPVSRAALGFAANAGTDALSFAPVGTIAKALGIPSALNLGTDFLRGTIKSADEGAAASNIANEAIPKGDSLFNSPLKYYGDISKPLDAPYASYGWQQPITNTLADTLNKIAPEGVPGAKQAINFAVDNPLTNGVRDTFGRMFTKNYGTSEGVNSGLTDLQGTQALNDLHLKNNMVELHDMIKDLPQTEIEQIPHMIEGTIPTLPELQPYIDKWKDIRDNGITLPDGTRAGGTNQELNTFFNGRAVLDRTKGNGTYYPLQMEEPQQAIDAALQNSGNKGFSTSGAFNQQRTFNTAKEAIDAGFNPEMNPTLALTQRMNQSLRATSNADFLNQMLDKGIISKEQLAGMQASSTKPFDSFFTTYDKKPTGSSPLSALLNPSNATAGPLTKLSDLGYAIPKELSRSAPRYRGNALDFSSPLDKAAYIVGNTTTRSARDADFMKSLMDHTGLSETDLRAYGSHVRNSIKDVATGAADGEKIKVPSILSNLPEHAPKTPLSTAEETASNLADNQNFSSLTNSLQQAQPGKSIVKVNPYYIKPADEAALREHLDPSKPTGLFKVAGKGTDLYNKGLLLGGAPHMHNVNVNGVVLGGAKPSYIKEAYNNISKGLPDQNYMNALKSGAVSRIGNGGVVDAVKQAITPANGNMLSQTLNATKDSFSSLPTSFKDLISKVAAPFKPTIGRAMNASHDLLWNDDAAIRTALNRQELESGATAQQAAANTNKFMVDYNNLTPFEKKYIKPIIPFYAWKKGNLPLQAAQTIAQTPKYMAMNNINNAISQAVSGQPTDAKGRINSGQILSDGSNTMVDPYISMSDAAKVGEKGILPYAYNSLSPGIKEIFNQGASLGQYFGAPWQAKFPIYNNQAPLGYNIRAGLAHATNALNPFNSSAILGQAGSQSNFINKQFGVPLTNPNASGITPLETITKILGGFTGRDNPVTDAKNQYYQTKQNQLDLRRFMKVEAKVNANK